MTAPWRRSSICPIFVADALVDAVVRLDPSFSRPRARGFQGHHADRRADPRVCGRSSRRTGSPLGEALGAFRLALDHSTGSSRAGMRPTSKPSSTHPPRSGWNAVKIHVTPVERRRRAGAAL